MTHDSSFELRHQLLYGWPSGKAVCAAINAQGLAGFVLQITPEANLGEAHVIYRVPKDFDKIPDTYNL